MSGQRYSEEFKVQVERDVVEKDHDSLGGLLTP